MSRRHYVIGAITLCSLGSLMITRAQAPKSAPQPMGFFVTSAGLGKGADLGGLAGADQHCQKLAAAAGAGSRTWRAYLSTSVSGGQAAVNARDRIGPGPWFSVKGVLVASNVADLHGDQQRDRNNMQRANVLDAKGNQIQGGGTQGVQNEHDILTGSDAQGRAFTDGLDHTCNNWTSDQMTLPQQNPNVPAERARAMLGHTDRSGGGNVSWNAAHMSQGCSKQALINTGGAGRFYCFATN